jgi:hypothetical protein
MAIIENVIPILRVRDIEASRRYYVGTLGFALEWDADGMIAVSRDRKSIMLCEGGQGRPGTWLWIGVEDADAFFAEFSARGALIRSPPQNFSWAYEVPGRRTARSGTDCCPNTSNVGRGSHTLCCIRFHCSATTTAL